MEQEIDSLLLHYIVIFFLSSSQDLVRKVFHKEWAMGKNLHLLLEHLSKCCGPRDHTQLKEALQC